MQNIYVRVKQRLRSIRFRNRILLVCTTFIAIIAISSLILFMRTINVYTQTLYKETAHSLSFISTDITAQLQSICSVSEYLATDNIIQNGLSKTYTSLSSFDRNRLREKYTERMYAYFNSNKYIVSLTLITDRFTLCHGRNSLQEENEYIEQMKQTACEHHGGEVWFPSQQDNKTVLLIREIRKIENLDLDYLGLLIIRVDLDHIVKATLNHYEYLSTDNPLIISSKDKIIYPNLAANDKLLPAVNDLHVNSYGIIDVNGDSTFAVTKKMNYPEWNYSLFVPYETIFKSISNSTFTMIFLIVLIGISLVVIASAISKNMTKHFYTLTLKMNSLKSGILDPINVHYDYSSRCDELGVLHHNFDEMLYDFKHLTMDNYTKQLLIKDAQIKALEQQINPHFLYNTLDSINWRAKAIKETEISTMVEALGKLLRCTISEQGDVIPLRKELSITDNYIKIQRIRFIERLLYSCEIDDTLLDKMVPKMSIQPLIENAMKYGVEHMITPCSIQLKIGSVNNCIQIQVINDGSIIPTDILEQLRAGQTIPKGCGVGLLNIDSRIKLLFGDTYGLFFYSSGEKTTVTMLLPLDQG